jgi:hypothetical protein
MAAGTLAGIQNGRSGARSNHRRRRPPRPAHQGHGIERIPEAGDSGGGDDPCVGADAPGEQLEPTTPSARAHPTMRRGLICTHRIC